MPKFFEQQSADDAPLYIRWSPDRVPYAVELKLDLVPVLLRELDQAAKLGIEIGGVLFGSLPDAMTPTLRIDEIEIIRRSPADGATFVLDPGQQARFSEIRRRIGRKGKAALGLFRSHVRPGQLKPSLADRTLLSGEFKQPIYAALLIQGNEPRTAAFFLAANGRLPAEPSVREFRFNEADFRALPEVEMDGPPGGEELRPRRRSKIGQYGLAAVLCIGLIAGIFLWPLVRQASLPEWLKPSRELQLGISSERGNVLRISWNHAARQFDGSTGARVMISDGNMSREIKLGMDELRLGAVEYERSSPRIHVTVTVDGTGGPLANESMTWEQR